MGCFAMPDGSGGIMYAYLVLLQRSPRILRGGRRVIQKFNFLERLSAVCLE